jgi:hypothetical protein
VLLVLAFGAVGEALRSWPRCRSRWSTASGCSGRWAMMMGGMMTAPLLPMLVIQAAYLLMTRRRCTPVTAMTQRKEEAE